ncbi:unnamed protein product [Schistocephalus solidus]|uniref:G_PROTEIN_RECEP_F1_2 domain-containing protein n=1 Tax=Schistocephalus solidus TaxID=70667 RepID=A0A183T308_SCHSO|nr:unnamed protein product [Schistocephalus solidus]
MEASTKLWSCRVDSHWPDGLDICEVTLSIFGLIGNFTVTVLLFLLRSKNSEALTLLRVLSFSSLMSTFVEFVHDEVIPNKSTGNVVFDGLVCVLWSSRFLYWYSKAHVYHSLFYFTCNRAIDMLNIRIHLITTKKQRLTAFLLLIFISSFLSAAPQFLLAQPHVPKCACALPTENFAILSMIYAHVFLWVAIFGVIYPIILVYICIALLLRLRRRENCALVDELDQLVFVKARSSASCIISDALAVSSPTEAEASIINNPRAATTSRSKDVSARYVWSASFCIIPLSAAYIVTFSYDATYQFLSAAGQITYVLHSPAQKFSHILLSLFGSMVPLILFFHIPAMRSLIFVVIVSIGKRCRSVRSTDVGDQLT